MPDDLWADRYFASQDRQCVACGHRWSGNPWECPSCGAQQQP